MHEFDKANLKHPSFREEYGGVTAIIHREIFMSIRGNRKPTGINDTKNEDNGAKNGANMTTRQVEIVSLIRRNPLISLDEIADKLRAGTTTIDREIKKLNNVIRRVGPRNGGRWEITEL